MTPKTKAPKKQPASKPPRWSIGLFRNPTGRLVTIYVTAGGVPMPYEKKRINGNKILFHEVITGVKYSVARQRLLRDSQLKDEPVAANGKAVAKKKAKVERRTK